MTCVVETMTRVYPSAGDFATASVPMVDPAPGRFSMMIGCPSTGASSFWRMRATTSVKPPGPKGTMIFTGFDGYVSAAAGNARAARARAARAIFLMGRVEVGSAAVDGIRLREEGVQDV